jgi:hypothetical protein
MAYFLSGFKTGPGDSPAYGRLFKDILPDPDRTSYRALSANHDAFLVDFDSEKIIPNIVISDDKLGSWLALLGTPLIERRFREQRRALLDGFLDDPARLLRGGIDGNFAAFCYDARRKRFIVATDFNNTTPVFYADTPSGVFFCSHELVLARLLNAEISLPGFYQSVNLGLTWGSHTRFERINKTLPCQILVVDDAKRLHREPYWRPQEERPDPSSFDGLIEIWLDALKDSIWKYYEGSGQKPVISDFTAGEDSRLIVSQCHALGIPFVGQVRGSEESPDVVIARRAAGRLGFELIVRPMHYLTSEQLLAEAVRIAIRGDAYKEFTISCIDAATELRSPLDDYGIVKYCGVPGGEAFRGSYYLRGKALFPSLKTKLDYRFFTRMKFLLDHHPGLLRYPDSDGLETIFGLVQSHLDDVEDFPLGIQIDHMLRVFQTCSEGLKYKNPLYLPFAVNRLTRSVYSIPPRFKRGGKLTRACTEILYPELAVLKTQKGVPTIRKTLWRQPRFLPEYYSLLKGISSGAASRLFKWRRGNKWYYDQQKNLYVFSTLLNNRPYSDWFSSSKTMKTGPLYNPDILDPILAKARTGSCKYLPLLGRIVNQELAFRWVSGEGA